MDVQCDTTKLRRDLKRLGKSAHRAAIRRAMGWERNRIIRDTHREQARLLTARTGRQLRQRCGGA